jgi:hypothetical protein
MSAGGVTAQAVKLYVFGLPVLLVGLSPKAAVSVAPRDPLAKVSMSPVDTSFEFPRVPVGVVDWGPAAGEAQLVLGEPCGSSHVASAGNAAGFSTRALSRRGSGFRSSHLRSWRCKRLRIRRVRAGDRYGAPNKRQHAVACHSWKCLPSRAHRGEYGLWHGHRSFRQSVYRWWSTCVYRPVIRTGGQ